jgi:hypothetical protein
MECSLDKEKIKQGIADTVKVMVENTGLFTIVEDKVFSNKKAEETPELTADQIERIEGSREFVDTLDIMYRESFLADPGEFLRFIASQANSSESESAGALQIAGMTMFKRALQVFPNEGKVLEESEAIRNINKEFRDEVLMKTGQAEWSIWPSDELAMQYLMAQPKTADAIIAELRTKYLSQFSSTSINLLSDDLWLNHPILQTPGIKELLTFAKKINPEFKVVIVDKLDANAVSLIRDNIIFIRQGSIISELPEEVSHFFFELLPDDHPIKIEMLEKVVDFPIYLETFNKYKNNPAYQRNSRPDVAKIKREAAAKLIGEYIKSAYRNEADEKYGKKRGWLRQIIHDFMKWLRKTFVTKSKDVYTEPIIDINSPFRTAAESIIKGDITELNLQKVPSIYDSIFFSQVEDAFPEGYEASDIAKSLYEFSRALKRQVTKTFFTYVEKENMQGIKELLNDPSNRDYNRIWDIVSRFDDAGLLLKEMVDNNVVDDYIPMIRATSSLAEAYREMEQIPIAINQVLKKMSKEKTEEQLLNNITELQTYFQFSDTFKNITDEFIRLLGFIRNAYPDETQGVGLIYETMIEKMGATEIQFKVVDEQIMRMLQAHIINLTHKWTDEAFTKYRGEIDSLHDSLEHHKLKNKVSKLITEKITGLEQIRQAVTGNIPNAKDLMLPDGTKVNLKKIKDMSQIDYVVFMFSSPTLIADPFVSNVIAHFTDKYIASVVKGAREAKVFADKIMPIKKELSDLGVDWYEAENAVQNVQSFYDQSLEDKKTEKRTLLSATNRFDFQFEKQVKLQEIVEISREVGKLQAEYRDSQDDARKTELKDTLIPAKQKLLQEKREEYDKWLNDWSYRPYTPEFYAKQAQLKDSKTDSPSLRRMKEINRKLVILEEKQYVIIAAEATINEPLYDSVTQEIAKLQNEKLQLQDLIPPTEKAILDLMNEIYEVDEVATSRLRQRHKNQWVRTFVDHQVETGKKNRPEAEAHANAAYDALYTIVVPNQTFYDTRSAIFDEINAIARPLTGLDSLAARLDELKEKEKKLLKPFRDMRGEVNVTSFKYLSIEKDKNGRDMLLSESLKQLEEEVDLINQKMRIYSVVLTSPTLGEAEKKQILGFIDLSMAFNTVINNHMNYKAADVKETFKGLIPLTDSQAEQILSATKKAMAGDNSEFNNLANLQLGAVEPHIKSAYSVMTFASPQEMTDAENAMYGAFKQLTRRERGMMAESLAVKYQELNDLYTNSVSLQYYLSLGEFFTFYQEYIQQDVFDLPDKELHAQKFLAVRGNAPATVADIENMLGDGVFEAVLNYINWKEKNEQNPSAGYPLSDLIDFLLSIHKQKTSYVDGEAVTTWTPINYVKKPITDPSLTETRAPRFLTRNRIKEEYRTEKIYETNPDGKSPNVDINGEWLPLEKTDSPFWNKEYDKLKNASDAIGKKEFELLQIMTQEYLKAQENYLPEGERLDLVIPAKHLDKLEQKKFFITQLSEGWKYIRNVNPFGRGKTIEEEEQNYLEDINAVTAQNRDIYTGAVISEKNVKLRSRRRIPLARTSKDATSSLVMFIEDVNEYSGKTVVAPIMKSFADVFKYSHEQNPRTNRVRQGVLSDLYTTKILGEVPDNFANNPTISKVLAVVNRLTTFRLLGDPIGAIVNLTSGTIQSLVEANFSKAEFANYMSSGWIAKDWLYQYDKDFYKGSEWGLQTQLITTFNMIPDGIDVSRQLSKPALWANIRSKLMAPRSESEKLLAIHLGLSVVLAEPIIHEGKKITIQDMYELDKVTNLIELKNEYKSLAKEWNPVDGTKVIMLRRRLMQKYTMLQGNFFNQNQSYASTTAIGKSAEIMKRWFASGVIRRFQGEVIDPNLGETRKGYLLALANALQSLFYGVRKGDMQYINEYFSKIAKRPSEKLAIRRAAAEFLYVTVFGLLAMFVLGYDDDDEDKNKKLREMSYLKQIALLITLRVQGELGTFIPVPVFGLGYMEMKRAVLDPFGLPKASFDNIMGLGALMFMQIMNAFGLDFDKALYYQKGKPYGYNFGGLGAFKDKGDSKLKALILNTVGYTGYTFEPAEYIKTLTQMQNRIK